MGLKSIESFAKELFTFARVIRKVPLWPLALPLLLCARLLRPILLIRFNALRPEIGHFAANTEIFLCERDAGINDPHRPHLDFCFLMRPVVPNEQLATMWSRTIRLWPQRLFSSIDTLNNILPGGDVHRATPNPESDRDIYDLLPSTKPHIGFTAEEEAKGEAGLRALGIPSGAKFVCVIARDEAYHRTRYPGQSFDYHSYRNSEIENYLPAAELLAERGYWVVRMGAVVKDPLRSTRPSIVDYATSGKRTDFMDIYLAAKCTFCLSSGTGFDAVPVIFRRPIAYVNMVPLGYFPSYLEGTVGVCKKHRLVAENRFLTLREIVDMGLASCLTTDCFSGKGVELVENSASEILDVVTEMDERLSGNRILDERDEELQRRFWELYPIQLRDAYKGNPLHGKIRAHYSARFLRDNPEWLA